MRLLAAVLAAGLLALAGCGGGASSNARSAPSKARYSAGAEAICRGAAAQTKPLIERLTAAAAPSSAPASAIAAGEARALAGIVRRLHAIAGSSLARLRALRRPSAAHAAIARFLNAYARVAAALGRASAAAGAGRLEQAVSQLGRAASAAQQLRAAADAYGLTACGTVLTALGGGSSAASGLHVELVGESREPTVNRPWHYTVYVSGPDKAKPSGTETTRYLFGGAVVGIEKPQNVPFKDGVYRDTIEFPGEAVGYPLTLQVVVHTATATASAERPIEVRR